MTTARPARDYRGQHPDVLAAIEAEAAAGPRRPERQPKYGDSRRTPEAVLRAMDSAVSNGEPGYKTHG